MAVSWADVGETVKRRRIERGLSQRHAAELAQISATTWLSLEKHHQPVSSLTAAGMCRALSWTTDSIERLLGGGQPEPVSYIVSASGSSVSELTGHGTFEVTPPPIRLSAHGVDLDELRERDPEAYEAIMRQAEIALNRARERR